MNLTRKQIKSNRLWNHFKSYLPDKVYGSDLKEIINYNPEQWRTAFETFQTHGYKSLNDEEIYNIQPLITAQKLKEIFLTSLAEESAEYYGKGWGWIIPFRHTLDTHKLNHNKDRLDRLTLLAVLRTMKNIDPNCLRSRKYVPPKSTIMDFFLRHPGISKRTKYTMLSNILNQ